MHNTHTYRYNTNIQAYTHAILFQMHACIQTLNVLHTAHTHVLPVVCKGIQKGKKWVHAMLQH
eukprot:NODE_2043_length_463_cov_145.869565_g1964_i0.p2 GENE.NODE_2043_length_463_cov_145.869565_g1964_i0~~NODE_2043_length_463_cov_145.869565_g1964_i0.p2  ORF type:complete len:63 (-),score=6.85 NODE_2043_length_463_cov_145.869565_g1964_i0:174-362(-)